MLKAGYGKADITPPPGVDMAGYGYYLDRTADSVLDPLFARSVVIDANGRIVVLISCDLIGLTVEFTDECRRSIARKFETQVENVLLACTHTHSGPVTTSNIGMGKVDKKYLSTVAAKILSAVEDAYSDMQSARIGSATRPINSIGYNRTSSTEAIESNLGLIVFEREKDSLLLINFACHPVTLGVNRAISGDFPSALVGLFEAEGFPSLFFNGCCADIDPIVNRNKWGTGTMEDVRAYASYLYQEINKLRPRLAWSRSDEILSAQKNIFLPVTVPSLEAIEEAMKKPSKTRRITEGYKRFTYEWLMHAKRMLLKRGSSPADHRVAAIVQVVSVGNAKLIGISGEVFSSFALRIRRSFPDENIFLIGYANGVSGYFPSRKAFVNRNCYECYIAPRIFGNFPFSEDVEDRLIEAVEQLNSSL